MIHVERITTTRGPRIRIAGRPPIELTPDQARLLALDLLDAYDHHHMETR